MTFSVIFLKTDDLFSRRRHTLSTLSAFPGDRSSRVLVNSAAKKYLHFY